ncbi:hypothetical protein C0991_012309 [Blastosporella zonata]|nr:hypothetical protein C0991_012309 [Blastosporella zonata]
MSKRILTILTKWFPEDMSRGLEVPRLTFLALWYLERIFHRGLFNAYDVKAIGAPEAAVRGFLLGLTLADKWLHDGARPIRNWQKYCNISLHAANLAEKTALMMLEYNICITQAEWYKWLLTLKPSASKFTSTSFGEITAVAALEVIIQRDAPDGPQGSCPSRDEDEDNNNKMCPRLLCALRDHLLG